MCIKGFSGGADDDLEDLGLVGTVNATLVVPATRALGMDCIPVGAGFIHSGSGS